MRNKRFLSTVVATALTATTMAMPVMAADGGELNVDVSTRTAVIRVAVPTSLAVAVNQFEKGDTGSQIYSEDFDITNKSEIPVKLNVTSTATLDATKPITLVSTKAAVAGSTEADGAAWLAVAAMTGADTYTSGDIKDLTEADANITTFTQKADAKSTATADQVFYLDAVEPQAPATTPDITYTKLAPTDADTLAAAKKTSYAQIFEISAATLTGGSEQDDLNNLIANGDVYKEVSGTMTLIEKGTSDTYTAGNQYYTVVGSVLAKDLTANKIYVYGEADEGGKAGFRYIGKLSENKETWSESDLSQIVIKYDIAGVTGTRYGEVEDECTYGLYHEAPAAPTEVAGTKLAKGDGTAITGASAIATRLKGTAATQFQFDVSQADLTGLEVTKIVIDSNEYEFTSSANSASTAASVSDGKLYTIKNFTANTVAKIQFYYGDASGNKYIVTWTIS